MNGTPDSRGKTIPGKIISFSLIAAVALLATACFNIILEEPPALPEEPSALLEDPPALLEEPPALLEEPSALLEDPPALLEEPAALPEEPSASLEEPSVLLEEPPALQEEPSAMPEAITVMPVSGGLDLLPEPQSPDQGPSNVDAPELDSAAGTIVPTLISSPTFAIMPDPLPAYRLSVNGVPANDPLLVLDGGTVEVSLPPQEPAGLYWGGDRIHLTAIPEEGYLFDSWGGDCVSDGNICVITIEGDEDLIAGFVPLEGFFFGLDLDVDPDGAGKVQVQPPPNAPHGRYLVGTHLELTAMDSEGFAFTGWDGACVGEFRECRIVMNSHLSVKARFVPALYTLTVNRVLVDGAGVSVGHGKIAVFPFAHASNSGFARSAVVSLTVDPDAGYVVVEWGGDCSGMEPDTNVCTLIMDGDKLVEVTFAEEVDDPPGTNTG